MLRATSQSEPSQKEIIEIVDLAEELNAKYILFEQNVSSNLTSVIQDEVGAKSLTLHNLSVLTQEDVANNEDYFTLMKKNIETFKEACVVKYRCHPQQVVVSLLSRLYQH
ncbi:hypothetical protein UACE39S_04479 [Ureibacillus acetophenoni]